MCDKPKTNILLILADQQRYDTIGQAGYEYMITPNLDKLAREGCIFHQAYSSNPVCMPARHDLLLGMPSKAHGYFANCETKCMEDYSLPTLPRVFTEAGYRTAAIGKMHFYPSRMHHGYSELYTMEELPKMREDDDYAMYLKEQGLEDIQNIHGIRPLVYHMPQVAQVPEEQYETNWIKNKTINWLKDNNKQPFLLCVGYIKPHPPWDIPEKYADLYKDKTIKESIPRSRVYPNSQKHNAWYGDDDTEETKRSIREAYYTSITMVDESVGAILEHLRNTGELDNTLVIYTSDHGEMLQDKGYYSKELPYESSVHIPFIMRHPNYIESGSTSDELISLLDIFPTCLDAAGLNYPQSKDKEALVGESLLRKNLLHNRETVISASGFVEKSRWVMCRNKSYKYVYHYNQGYEEFYDLVQDSDELLNCIDEMRGTTIYHELRNKVLEYEKIWGPDDSIMNEELRIVDGKLLEPYVNGKYHLWSNMQFQKFNQNSSEKREKQFCEEFEKVKQCNLFSKYEYEKFRSMEWKQFFEAQFHDFLS